MGKFTKRKPYLALFYTDPEHESVVYLREIQDILKMKYAVVFADTSKSAFAREEPELAVETENSSWEKYNGSEEVKQALQNLVQALIPKRGLKNKVALTE